MAETVAAAGTMLLVTADNALTAGLLDALDRAVRSVPAYAAAHPSDSTSACSRTVSVAFSCLSGG